MAKYIKRGYHNQIYCVWANDDDELPLIVGTYQECAAYIGVKPKSFLTNMSHHCYDEAHHDSHYPQRHRFVAKEV